MTLVGLDSMPSTHISPYTPSLDCALTRPNTALKRPTIPFLINRAGRKKNKGASN